MSKYGETVIELAYNSASDILTLRRSDGSTIKKVNLSGVSANTLGPFTFDFNTNINAPPSNSQVRLDSTVINEVTKIWVSNLDNNNTDVRNILLFAVAGNTIYIQDKDDSKSFKSFSIQEVPTVQEDSYVTFSVALNKDSGIPLKGSAILFGIIQ